MSLPTHPLHVWIFNDSSVVSLLRPGSPLWDDGVAPGLIVELSPHPTLAYALDLETPAAYPGVAGLLGGATAPADLVVRLPDVSIPAILAPAAPLSAATVTASLRRLATDARITGRRMVLVEASLAPSLAPALAACARLGVVWDLSATPGQGLEELLSALAAENLVRDDTWAGLLSYFSPDQEATAQERSAATVALASLPSARLLPALATA